MERSLAPTPSARPRSGFALRAVAFDLWETLITDTPANSQAQTKSRLGQPVDATNFRSDVNANGSINAGHVGLVKSKVGNAASCP